MPSIVLLSFGALLVMVGLASLILGHLGRPSGSRRGYLAALAIPGIVLMLLGW
jgi:hypothetical protein